MNNEETEDLPQLDWRSLAASGPVHASDLVWLSRDVRSYSNPAVAYGIRSLLNPGGECSISRKARDTYAAILAVWGADALTANLVRIKHATLLHAVCNDLESSSSHFDATAILSHAPKSFQNGDVHQCLALTIAGQILSTVLTNIRSFSNQGRRTWVKRHKHRQYWPQALLAALSTRPDCVELVIAICANLLHELLYLGTHERVPMINACLVWLSDQGVHPERIQEFAKWPACAGIAGQAFLLFEIHIAFGLSDASVRHRAVESIWKIYISALSDTDDHPDERSLQPLWSGTIGEALATLGQPSSRWNESWRSLAELRYRGRLEYSRGYKIWTSMTSLLVVGCAALRACSLLEARNLLLGLSSALLEYWHEPAIEGSLVPYHRSLDIVEAAARRFPATWWRLLDLRLMSVDIEFCVLAIDSMVKADVTRRRLGIVLHHYGIDARVLLERGKVEVSILCISGRKKALNAAWEHVEPILCSLHPGTAVRNGPNRVSLSDRVQRGIERREHRRAQRPIAPGIVADPFT